MTMTTAGNVTGAHQLCRENKMPQFKIRSDEDIHKDVNGKIFNFEFGWSVKDGAIWEARDERYPEDQQPEIHSKHLISIGG